jgi:hypothetical protein
MFVATAGSMTLAIDTKHENAHVWIFTAMVLVLHEVEELYLLTCA